MPVSKNRQTNKTKQKTTPPPPKKKKKKKKERKKKQTTNTDGKERKTKPQMLVANEKWLP